MAMSGGLDSSFSAYLLKKQGYKVVGVTFALLPKTLANTRNPKACCSLDSTNRARKVADSLSIAHYVINLRPQFEKHVIEKFVAEYRSGRTPNPCVLCNQYIKFSAFVQKALALGADAVATGHYATIEKSETGWLLKKAEDRSKDQSYFLYPIEQYRLPTLLFPMSGYTKEAVRLDMTGLAWDSSKVRESQDICFIPDRDYRRFISRYIPVRKGDIFLHDGRHLGYHEGVQLYTIGQRRGLNIPFADPLYVTQIRAEENVLIVGPKEQLRCRTLIADQINMLCTRSSGRALGRVRYRQKEEPCTYSVSNGRLEVTFDDSVSAVTPGQSVVLYEGDTVLGGGAILQAR
ncbi:MAG: tRNA 2-thiouridine(34) synthase MnmA [Syntrophorhabdales bacterium]